MRFKHVPVAAILLVAGNSPAFADADGGPQLSIVEYPPTTSSTTLAMDHLLPGSKSSWAWQLVAPNPADRLTHGRRVTNKVAVNSLGKAQLRLSLRHAGTYLIDVSGISSNGHRVAAATSLTVTADNSGGAESDLPVTADPEANAPVHDVSADPVTPPGPVQPSGVLTGVATLAMAGGVASVELARRRRADSKQ